jgi:hypothetical protein
MLVGSMGKTLDSGRAVGAGVSAAERSQRMRAVVRARWAKVR